MDSGTFNILHLTLGGDDSVYGDRNPAVWFENKGIHIVSSISGNKHNFKNIKPPLQAGKWMHFKISQILIDNKV